MPCKVIGINACIGSDVQPGQVVIVVESMKMEITIAVKMAGKFQTRWKIGGAVEEGSVLCTVE